MEMALSRLEVVTMECCCLCFWFHLTTVSQLRFPCQRVY